MSDKTYAVHERFATFQGEGVHMGRPAFFLRTYGCPVHCPWCDSAGTWHPKFVPKGIERMSALEVLEEVREAGMSILVVTGGEPTMFDLRPLIDEAHHRVDVDRVAVHLETSGAFPIRGKLDWITLSPKKWKLPLEVNIQMADEFKIIVETPSDIDFYTKLLCAARSDFDVTMPIWLHPEWSQRENKDVLKAISEMVKIGGGMYRAGWQVHKLYKVDTLDSRSAVPVPLGGDPAKGF